MPGFLSKYEGTDRILIDEEYWVDVLKCLTEVQSRDAEKAGMAFAMVQDPDPRKPDKLKTEATIDPEAKGFEQVLASLVAWNLTDGDGNPLPLDYDRDYEQAARAQYGGRGNAWKSKRRLSLERLPKPVFDLLVREVGRANLAPTREETKSFSVGNGSSVLSGQDEAPDLVEVRGREVVLAAPGDPGGPPTTD